MNSQRPLSVNLVVTLKCNYNCRFCFGHLRDIRKPLLTGRILEIPKLLAEAGCQKLTLEGGEPFLFPRLDEILYSAKKAGLTTCIVSNGSPITEDILESIFDTVDWLGISIDSASEKIERKLGRGNGNHVLNTVEVAEWAHEMGIRLKINSVITSLNYEEDMTKLISCLAPERWKAFQILQIEGENDTAIQDLLISKEQFEIFIEKNKKISSKGISFIPEYNNDMIGSYVMLLPDGRFFSNHGGKHIFGKQSIFEVGVLEALAEVGWDEEKFQRRGGKYDWGKPFFTNPRKGGKSMSDKKMSKKAASRIQSHADKTGRNQGFKSRAQKSAAKKK